MGRPRKIKEEPVETIEPAVPTFEAEPVYDVAEHTVVSFCCSPMMRFMLGGQSQACGISQTTGMVQIGGIDAYFCPYCGKSIITAEVPKDTTEE